uniref:Venom S1 protease 12 n=1 Tax=Oncocephalus sp. TaxID=2944721 RepID=A0AB38ZEL0_9HEMI
MRLVIISLLALIAGNAIADDIDSSEYGTGGGVREPSCRCGWTNNKMSRIVNGDDAGVNEFPWVVGIKEADDLGPGCGGVILSERIVLTAAHCTEPMSQSQIVVLVGEHNIFDESETPAAQMINVEKYVQHPDYDINENLENDIALLLLEEAIVMSDRVGPICFPSEKVNLVTELVTVMGWGKLGTNKGPSPVLKKTQVKCIPLDICKKVYGGIETNAKKANQICTYTKNKDSCQGDSGGPVVWRDPEMNLYTNQAIISYGGDECGEAPGISTHVFSHKEWILKTMHELDPTQKVCTKI